MYLSRFICNSSNQLGLQKSLAQGFVLLQKLLCKLFCGAPEDATGAPSAGAGGVACSTASARVLVMLAPRSSLCLRTHPAVHSVYLGFILLPRLMFSLITLQREGTSPVLRGHQSCDARNRQAPEGHQHSRAPELPGPWWRRSGGGSSPGSFPSHLTLQVPFPPFLWPCSLPRSPGPTPPSGHVRIWISDHWLLLRTISANPPVAAHS